MGFPAGTWLSRNVLAWTVTEVTDWSGTASRPQGQAARRQEPSAKGCIRPQKETGSSR